MKRESRSMVRNLLATLAFTVGAMVAVVWFTGGWEETRSALAEFNPWLLLVCLGLIVTAWTCSGVRFFILSGALGKRVPLLDCIRISLISEFGVSASPAGTGGGIARVALLKRAGIPVGEAVSLITVDFFLDLIYFFFLIPMGLPRLILFLKEQEIRTDIILLIAVCGILIAAFFLGLRKFFFQKNEEKAGMRTRKKRPSSGSSRPRFRVYWRWFRIRIPAWKREFRNGFRSMLRVKKGTVALALIPAFIQWTCRYAVLPVVILGLEGSEDFFAFFLLQGTMLFLRNIVVLPGGGGTVEGMVSLILPEGINPGAAILLWRFFTFHLYLLTGGIVLLMSLRSGLRLGGGESFDEDR